MARDINFHSRMVGWAKVILPVMGIALLSTLFLFSRSSTESNEIPFAQLSELAEEQRINAPEFSGVAADGSIIKISARSAQPLEGQLDTLSIDGPSLRLDSPDGTELTISAGEGLIDGPNRYAELSGLARLETSSGYMMETAGLRADLATGEIVSDGRLKVLAPFGELEAGNVSILVPSMDEGQQMHFTDGVRMLYQPQSRIEE